MNREDKYLESMLTDLDSAYYQTLLGEGTERRTQAGVAERAPETHGERPGRPAASGGPAVAAQVPRPRPGRWRVADVMATDVITVGRNMPFHQVAKVLAENDLSAVPVVSGGGHVLGVISEADLLRKEERFFSRLGSGLPRRTHQERRQANAMTAEGLMTSPAITIHPDAPLGEAARLMNGRRICQLPVVNPDRELIGLVCRHDLLSAFLRPDSDIAAEITGELGPAAGQVAVTVTDGEVTLVGELPGPGQVADAVKIATAVDGVVAVYSRLTVGPR